MSTAFLNRVAIHKDWEPFLSGTRRRQIARVESEILPTGITPPPEKVLRFLEFPLHSAKIVILGQDPYPQPGVATGRAFEVGNLKSWNQPFRNSSLKNILRALYKAYTGEVIKFNDLKKKFDNAFPVLPPPRFFKHWEAEGVLLLNTAFTCTPGAPGSHRKNWQAFTRDLLFYIRENAAGATWFLWGNHALEATEGLSPGRSCFAMHPMMCYDLPGRENDFLFGRHNCFEPFIGDIDWTGYGLEKRITAPGKLF